MAFPHQVERWRAVARAAAAWAAARCGVAYDEHDLLALVERESSGNPAKENSSGRRGLGQVYQGALSDYNAKSGGPRVEWAWMKDPERGAEQLRVVAWLRANSRQIVSTWTPPDAHQNAHLWGDLRYGWGGGHVKDAIEKYRAQHGHAPNFVELEAVTPAAIDVDGNGTTDIRPFIHARAVARRAQQDGAEAPIPLPFSPPNRWAIAAVVIAVIAVLAVGLVLWYRHRKAA